MPSALATFSKKFPTNEPCKLWDAIQASTTHTDPTEKRAVARGDCQGYSQLLRRPIRECLLPRSLPVS